MPEASSLEFGDEKKGRQGGDSRMREAAEAELGASFTETSSKTSGVNSATEIQAQAA
jgi:hypothetical protein